MAKLECLQGYFEATVIEAIFNLFIFISHIIQEVIYNGKNDFYIISLRDMGGCHQRTHSVWLMAHTRLQENKYTCIWKNDHKEGKKGSKNYVHEIPIVCVTAIHWQSDPVIKWARTIVTMHPGQFPMAKRITLARPNGRIWPGRRITLVGEFMGEPYTLYTINGK